MTITIDLGPQILAALARAAATHGRTVETHAAHVLEEAVQVPADPALDTITDGLEIDDSPDPAEGVYTATGDFHMMVCAETQDELEHALQQALWHDYAMADPDTLSADAVALREQLMATSAESADTRNIRLLVAPPVHQHSRTLCQNLGQR